MQRSDSISNSYATGDVSASSSSSRSIAGGLVGWLQSGSSIVGKNYYVDSDGTNGIGSRHMRKYDLHTRNRFG